MIEDYNVAANDGNNKLITLAYRQQDPEVSTRQTQGACIQGKDPKQAISQRLAFPKSATTSHSPMKISLLNTAFKERNITSKNNNIKIGFFHI